MMAYGYMEVYLLLILLPSIVSGTTNATLEITTDSTDDNLTVGMKRTLTVTSTFTEGDTTDVQVELIAIADHIDTTMALGKIISVTKGVDLAFSNPAFAESVSMQRGSEYNDTTLGVAYYTVAVYDLGTVSSSGGDNAVVFVYEVVYVSTVGVTDGQTVSTGAGMVYNGGITMWVGIATFIQLLAPGIPGGSNSLNSAATANVPVGATYVHTLSFIITEPSADVTVSASFQGAPVYVKRMAVTGVSDAYAYAVYPDNIFVTPNMTCPPNETVSLHMGTIVNKESQIADVLLALSSISIDIAVQTTVYDDVTIIGSVYTMHVQVDVNGDATALTQDVDIIVTSNPAAVMLADDSLNFTLNTPTDGIVSPGHIAVADVRITIPRDTLWRYDVMLRTASKVGVHALSIQALTSFTFSTNVPCLPYQSELNRIESAIGSGIFDTGSYKFDALNQGVSTDAGADDMGFSVVLMVVPVTGVSENDTHGLLIIVNNEVVGSIEVIIGQPMLPPSTVDYQFTVASSLNCSSEYESGSSFAIDLEVTTEPEVMAGLLRILAPIPEVPPSSTSPRITVCGASVIQVGQNVMCVKAGDLALNTDNATVGMYTVELPNVCHHYMGGVENADDMFIVRFIMQIQDNETALEADLPHKLWLGASRYDYVQLWVGYYEMTIIAPVDLGATQIVSSVDVLLEDSPDTWPDTHVLQFSPDGSSFHNANPLWSSFTTGNATHVQYEMEQPLIARQVRLTSLACKATCRLSHGYTYRPPLDELGLFGEEVQASELLARYMLARDNDTATCLDLPRRTHAPPALWLKVDTTLLGLSGIYPYTLNLVGRGITGQSPTGPQVTRYGQIHVCVRELVLEKFGTEAWTNILNAAEFDENDQFMVFHRYGDPDTFKLLGAVCTVLGVDMPTVLEIFGEYFLQYCLKHGYDKMLKSLGANFRSFIQNLDSLHSLLELSYKNIVAPSFRCEQNMDGSLALHYYTTRPGLYPIVLGLVRAVARDLYNQVAEISVVDQCQQTLADNKIQEHVTFRVVLNSREEDVVSVMSAAPLFLPKEGFHISPEQFCNVFPYHIIFDSNLTIRQCGNMIQRALRTRITDSVCVEDIFEIVHPNMPMTVINIRMFINAVFMLKVKAVHSRRRKNGRVSTLLLKGQMMWLDDIQHMMFLGSPRLSSLTELVEMNVYLADIPLYDATRELVLLNQQRIAEIDIAKKLDETTIELKKTSKAFEKEKKKTECLLYQMLPEKVADDLKNGRQVPAEKFEQVTILFSDILTFTKIAAACPAMAVVNMLNDLYRRFDDRTNVHRVYKVETIGDAYMIVSGVPVKTTTHAQPVARFALDIVQEAKHVLSPATGKPLQIRIGVHTGPVVSGVVGTKMPRYCLFGDTVNTASRMETHGVPGRIHISHSTYEKLAETQEFKFRKRGEIDVKGKGRMATYFLVGAMEPEDGCRKLPLLGSVDSDDCRTYPLLETSVDVPSSRITSPATKVVQTRKPKSKTCEIL